MQDHGLIMEASHKKHRPHIGESTGEEAHKTTGLMEASHKKHRPHIGESTGEEACKTTGL